MVSIWKFFCAASRRERQVSLRSRQSPRVWRYDTVVVDRGGLTEANGIGHELFMMEGTKGRVPSWAKAAYSAFVAVLVPSYWVTYSPWNFLYFCDIALLVTAVAIWVESPLLISMQAIAILAPQMLWVVDFLCQLVAGVHVTGVTKYMFDPNIPLFFRGLSLFHGWLPFALLWLLSRLSYDRRAFGIQSVVAIVVILISYLFAPAPPPPPNIPTWAVNINYVYGLDDNQAQTLMAPWVWVLCVMAVNLIGFYLPTHFALRRFYAAPSSSGRWAVAP